MSALAHRRFLKMHGAGNAIVVLDLSGSSATVRPAEARAIGQDPASAFDQLMVLHDPVSPGTDAFLRIYNTDGSESGACGNGTRCVASTGTVPTVGGVNLSYHCAGGLAAAVTSADDGPWTAVDARPDATVLQHTLVAGVWRT